MEGNDLREARKRLNLTQDALGKHLGVAPNTIARWERDEFPIPEYIPLAVEGLEFRLSKIKDA